MLELMQNLALCHLWKELEGNKAPPDDLRKWFINEKENDPCKFFSYLVEPAGKIKKFYALSAHPDNDDIAILESADIGSLEGNSAICLPFNKPSGPQSPQIGPVIKRSYNKQKGAGPSLKILRSTLKNFQEISLSNNSWAAYFKDVNEVFNRKQIYFAGEYLDCEENALHKAITIIPENEPVFLVFKDKNNQMPGDIPEYRKYLSSMLDADNKYTTGKAKPVQVDCCSCCGKEDVKGYPAGLAKAGINIFNIDREGAFPNITNSNAFLSYSICENCADLLYVFKFHVMNNYITYIAGQETLMLPELYLNPKFLNRFLTNYKNYIEKLDSVPDKALIAEKKKLINLLKNEEATCTIDIIWSKDSLRGQSIGNLSGQITDILPSRLRTIDSANKQFKDKHSVFFPEHRVEGFEFDLNLSFVQELLKRPGGKKAKQVNASQKLVELKRMFAESIYKQKLIFEKRFWEEVIITAKWYLLCLFEKDKPENDCLYEGYSEKKDKIIIWMSFAGWIKHLSMTLNYLQFMEVIKKMENKRTYFPEMEKLQNYFSDDCGINTDEKAYAFILGILYGKVMQMQGKKGVNVSANALTWLKRLTLTGSDLPDLYVKIRGKLLAYNAEGNEDIRAVIKEIGILGNKLGDEINLKQTSCCYFLLLGQSLTVDILPGKQNKK
ncbi:MAG: CRISPR-associated protein [Deltaproteobacteria bacterium]|nr:CRISPR-associated protein [Deltaproteobacteria bacterium]